MKRLFKMIIITIICLTIVAFPMDLGHVYADDAEASGTCGENLTWTLTGSSDYTLTISGTGEMNNYTGFSGEEAPWYSQREMITRVVIENGVTNIGDYAFLQFWKLKDISIPNSVLSIGNSAFCFCTGLTSITIPESVSNIDDGAFYECSALESLNIPERLTTLGDSTTFHGCKKLTDISFPDCVTSIGFQEFYGCSSLTKVNIPDSVTSIGEYAFYNCSNLTTITIPDTVTNVSYQGFHKCDKLKNVVYYGTDLNWNGVSGISSSDYYNTALTSATRYDVMIIEPEYTGDPVRPEISVTQGDTALVQDTDYTVSFGTETTEVDESGEAVISFIGSYADLGTVKHDYKVLPKSDNIVASGTCGDNLSWTLDEEGLLTISGEGEMTSWPGSDKVAWNAYKAEIKRVIIDNGVTSIGNNAFNGCSNLINIEIPAGVTRIESNAFSGCSGLTSITIPEGVTSIWAYAFSECSSLTSITIPEGVTDIWAYAFKGCSGLTSITIPEGFTSIEGWTFSDCSSLTSITIPESVTSIGVGAFYNCSSLTSITLPFIGGSKTENTHFGYIFGASSYDANYRHVPASLKEVVIKGNITEVSSYAFKGCSGLTSITIPEGVTSIGAYAFSGCSGLTSITIPESVTSIEDGAFQGCSSLTSITIPEGVIGISAYAFSGCSGLTSITIPESVTSIEVGAFSGCSGLTSITIPKGVISIGNGAFSGCSNLSSIEIPEGVTRIEINAFKGCSGLTSITIPESVTSIGQWAFEGCSSLTSIEIPEGVTSIGQWAFNRCSSLTSITLPFIGGSKTENTHFGYIFGASYNNNYSYVPASLKEVVIKGNITEVSSHAFSGCSGLTSITIPEGVTSIGAYAFSGCSGLTSITIPESVTSIEDGAFQGCSGLTSITIPEGVTSIGSYAFSSCSNLTSIEIPEGVTSIGQWAFIGCSSLTSITLPFIGGSKTENTHFGYIFGAPSYNDNHMHVPASLKEVVIKGNITVVSSYAFKGCSGLTSITIPESVTSIGVGAFYNCSSLTSITIPEGVIGISAYAFSGCSGLTSITIPESVTSIEVGAFSGCSGLTSITIPESVTSIGNGAFSGCSGLTSIYVIKYSYADTWLKDNYYSEKIKYVYESGDHYYYDTVVEATCTVPGLKTSLCVICSEKITEEIPALGHDYQEVEGSAVEPTCEGTGKQADRKCSHCGETITGEAIPALGHDLIHHDEKEATCTENGWEEYETCSRCDHTTYKEIPALGHDYKDVEGSAVAATCEEAGKQADKKCSRCEDTITGETIPALGHDWGEWTVTKEATTTEEGVETRVCKRDPSHTETRAIPKKETTLDSVMRIFGAFRYDTSIKSADALKEQLGLDKFDNVIIACGTNYADALAGSYLSCVKKAPILLVRNRQAEITLVQNYIKANLNQGGTIYLLGGSAVVPDAATAGLNGYNIKRLWGADRYATNVAILKEAGVSGDEIIVASGTGFADSLSASATGKPILLVKNVIQPSQKAYVESLAGKKFYLIGGTGAVNADIEEYFRTLGSVTRLGGATRFDTSVKVAETFFANPKVAVLAYGQDFPDGLCGGSVANAMGGPLLLATSGKSSQAEAYAKSNGIKYGAVLGGPTLINDAAVRTIFQMSASDRIVVK